jgi:hypothetical protein
MPLGNPPIQGIPGGKRWLIVGFTSTVNFPIPLFTSAVGCGKFFITFCLSYRVHDRRDLIRAGAIGHRQPHRLVHVTLLVWGSENLDGASLSSPNPHLLSRPPTRAAASPPCQAGCNRIGREAMVTAGRGRRRAKSRWGRISLRLGSCRSSPIARLDV